MALDLVQIRVLAEKEEDENRRFRQFLKTRCTLGLDEIDRRVFETTRRVWAGIDCTACANCCREMRPTFSEEEIDRVACRLGIERQQFIETYLERSESNSENPWQPRAIPCPFLKDNLCSVYEERPAECSGYPYLYKPDFVFRTMGDSFTAAPQERRAGIRSAIRSPGSKREGSGNPLKVPTAELRNANGRRNRQGASSNGSE